MGISEKKMKMVIENYFKAECNINTTIHDAFEKGFRIGVKKGLTVQPELLAHGGGELSAQPEQRWIPCSEGTPKKTSYYICTCHDGACYRTSVLKWSTGWVLTGARSYWKVIAWMPLPEPYKGDKT